MISFQRHLTLNLNRLGTALLRLGPPYSLPTGPPTTPLCLFVYLLRMLTNYAR